MRAETMTTFSLEVELKQVHGKPIGSKYSKMFIHFNSFLNTHILIADQAVQLANII